MNTEIKYLSFPEILNDLAKLKADTILFVTDEEVWDQYKGHFPFDEFLKEKQVHRFIARKGEMAKTFREYEGCLEFFLEKGVHRKSHLVALGGGALSDMAGFVAATLLRGILWSVIPTTLLSMVDASIGGKVAINSLYGKNLVGAFHLPQKVYLNTSFLQSLPSQEVMSGKGEIIKYAFLDRNIYDLIMNENGLDSIMQNCANYKLKITTEDFKEADKRKILNFGHSFGHAVEKIYGLPHGVAVLWGIAILFKITKDHKHFEYLTQLVDAMDFDIQYPPWHNHEFPVEEMLKLVGKDKKLTNADEIELITIPDIGGPSIRKYSLGSLRSMLTGALDEIRKITL